MNDNSMSKSDRKRVQVPVLDLTTGLPKVNHDLNDIAGKHNRMKSNSPDETKLDQLVTNAGHYE